MLTVGQSFTAHRIVPQAHREVRGDGRGNGIVLDKGIPDYPRLPQESNQISADARGARSLVKNMHSCRDLVLCVKIKVTDLQKLPSMCSIIIEPQLMLH